MHPQSNRNTPTQILLEPRDLMLPIQIGGPGDDDQVAMLHHKILITFAIIIGPEAKNALFAQRESDDRAVLYQVAGVIPVRAHVVAFLAVVPVEQQPVEAFIDAAGTICSRAGFHPQWAGHC